MNILQPFIIYAGDEENKVGLGHTKAWGDEEVSLTYPEQGELYTTAADYAKEFQQDCVLLVHGDRSAELVDQHGNSKPLPGLWHEVSASLAEHLDDWTKIGSRYFTVS